MDKRHIFTILVQTNVLAREMREGCRRTAYFATSVVAESFDVEDEFLSDDLAALTNMALNYVYWQYDGGDKGLPRPEFLKENPDR